MLNYETLGEAQDSIVFIHGIGGTTCYWRTRVQKLASNYRLILVDLLGYGESPKPWTKYTVDRHVVELYQVLQKQESLTLVGHSFGKIIRTPMIRSDVNIGLFMKTGSREGVETTKKYRDDDPLGECNES